MTTPGPGHTADAAAATGLDGVAVKPTEIDPATTAHLAVDLVTIDYEGPEHVPSPATLRRLAATGDLRVTIPVRADGFDPLGDDASLRSIPDAAGLVLVAGHPAYLSPAERDRAIAPRLAVALDRIPDAWVGTEGIERTALATGATQFELLSPGTPASIRALRAAGFDAAVAVYAPFALTGDDDHVLDALGAYVARRRDVARRLPPDASIGPAATGEARAVLLEAIEGYAITGRPNVVRDRVAALRDAGADSVIGYPARGRIDLDAA